MALLNIVSLPKYIDEIRISELFKSFDITAFNETMLDLSTSDGRLKFMVTILKLRKIDQGKGEVFVSFCEVRSVSKIVVT